MPILTTCPGCGHQGQARNDFAGKKIKCRKCQTFFVCPDPLEVNLTAEQIEALEGPAIPFTCEVCADAYQVAESLVGRKIRCRKCDEFVRVVEPQPLETKTPSEQIGVELVEEPESVIANHHPSELTTTDEPEQMPL